MAEVQAVKDLDTVKLINHLLKRTYGQQITDARGVVLILALRILKLLFIQFGNINNERLTLVGEKTSKQGQLLLRIREEHPDHIYLFQSYRNQCPKRFDQAPINRRSVS